MARTKITSRQTDWPSYALNIKSAKNTTAATPTNGANTNLGGNGAQVTFTVSSACKALVIVSVACQSSSDFEHRPCIFLDGSIYSFNESTASISGGAGNRSIQRTHSNVVSLPAGARTISAGIFISSATGQNVAIGGAEITVMVLGEVSA